jgi:hypothetical protein|tara:strand:- start:20609 stop:20755 length:147 start_codon:yes stop_codon:yes gene_type:complete
LLQLCFGGGLNLALARRKLESRRKGNFPDFLPFRKTTKIEMEATKIEL